MYMLSYWWLIKLPHWFKAFLPKIFGILTTQFGHVNIPVSTPNDFQSTLNDFARQVILSHQCDHSLLDISNYYRPQRSWGKVMFLQVRLILFTGGEYRTRYTPQDQVNSPGTRYTLRDQVHPHWTRYTPQDQVHPPDQIHPHGTRYTPPASGTPPGPGTPPRTRYIPPGPGTPPRAEHAGRYGLRVGGTHPTGMQSC